MKGPAIVDGTGFTMAGMSSLVGLLAQAKGHRNHDRPHASDMDP